MRVLWVGNSYTFRPKKVGGIPGVITLIEQSGGYEDGETDHVQLVRGGADLNSLANDFEKFWRDKDDANRVPDIIVLQDQSLTPGGGAVRGPPGAARERSLEALRGRYAPLLRGQQVVLYQSWGRPAAMHGQPDVLGDFERMSSLTAEGYRLYGEALSGAGVERVEIAPVGDAYSRLAATPRDAWLLPQLWADDIGHPTPAAALLAARVLARTLWRLRGRPWARHAGSLEALARTAEKIGVDPDMVEPIFRATEPEGQFGEEAEEQGKLEI